MKHENVYKELMKIKDSCYDLGAIRVNCHNVSLDKIGEDLEWIVESIIKSVARAEEELSTFLNSQPVEQRLNESNQYPKRRRYIPSGLI